MTNRNLKQEYEDLIKNNKIMLFMKGTPNAPQCGFSYRVVMILQELDAEYSSYNILEDNELREAIKEFASWPTYPQLYVNGELVGGCEIIEELFREGELEEILDLENK